MTRAVFRTVAIVLACSFFGCVETPHDPPASSANGNEEAASPPPSDPPESTATPPTAGEAPAAAEPATASTTEEDAQNVIPADVLAALREGEPLEFVSLYHDDEIEFAQEDEKFRRWKVLGRTTIDEPETRERLIAALERGVAESDLSPEDCFLPRHAFSTTHDGRRLDLVICFQCLQAQVSWDGRPDSRSAEEGYSFLIGESPQPLFDQVLRDASVTLDADVNFE